MPRRPQSIATEIRQSRPFRSPGQELALTLIRTASVLQARGTELLAASGLSLSQYNVLRILRGAGDEGHGTSAIRERMLDRSPGVTRLIDRLVAANLVTRDRHTTDRREVRCRITPQGLSLLEQLDPIVDGADLELAAQLSPAEQRTLVRLLDIVRSSVAESRRHALTRSQDMSFKKLFFSTEDDGALTVARVLLGSVMFAHGAQKALGWFGGYGWDGTMGFFTQQMHVPALFAALAILAEFLGGLGLITGLFGRIAAFGILANMVVAVAMVHAKVGFFMNWTGAQQGEGYEYHLLAAVLALIIIWKGSGAYSADRVIAQRA